jgi:hypothetical protein
MRGGGGAGSSLRGSGGGMTATGIGTVMKRLRCGGAGPADRGAGDDTAGDPTGEAAGAGERGE